MINHSKKAVKFLLIFFITLLIINAVLEKYYSGRYTNFGVTFSPRYAKYLKLDWQKTYIQVLDELKVKNLRIPSYWNSTEFEQNKFDFSWLDFMLEEAGKRDAKVILVLGIRQPRWPECHIPLWAKRLTVAERKQQLLEFVQETVKRYKDHPALWAWQVENEPLLSSFGEGCDAPDKDFLKEEVKLVRSLSNKTIIMTDSGELGLWATSMQLSDIFGTTLYRKVYDKLIGYVTYPIPAYAYNFKSNLIRKILAPYNKETIVVELQAEPWLADGRFGFPQEQSENFTTKDFKNYTDFAKKTGFDEVYLWGVEWWYFMADNGYTQYLDFAKTLF